jgi:hypothetical protein
MSTDLAHELDHRYRTRFANDAQKPYISKLGNEWQLLDSNGKVVKSASSMQALQGDLDRLLLASRDEQAKTLNPQKVKGGAVDAEGGLGPGYHIAEMEKALVALKARLRTTAGSERRDIEQDIQRLEFQLRERKRENNARDVEPLAMPPAKDHAYVVSRIGPYTISEGAGVDAGWWFVKGRGENKKYKSRQDAEMHAEMSVGE